jgi:hypothetical protein
MDRVCYLRLTVAAAVAVALAAAVGMSLVRSSGEKAGDHSTTPAREARETHGKATFAPTGAPRASSAELSADALTDRELDKATEFVKSGAGARAAARSSEVRENRNLEPGLSAGIASRGWDAQLARWKVVVEPPAAPGQGLGQW